VRKLKKTSVGILGATGMVGQNYVRLLENHPWFEVRAVAASPQSAGKPYSEAVAGKWQMPCEVPKEVQGLVVEDASNVKKISEQCELVFSALEMDKQQIKDLESSYAAQDIPLFSNASAHRSTEDVPVIIPEVNPQHLEIIPEQQKHYGWKKGFIVVKPNCSLQSYITPVAAIQAAGFEVEQIIVTTLQASSGAGYPGVPSMDLVDNVIPFISGEEEKTELEPLKIFGKIQSGKFVPALKPLISAHCNRVPVVDGHMACTSLQFAGKKPGIEEILQAWKDFKPEPQRLKLPFAPERAVIYKTEENRPQPRKDRDLDKAMAVTVGRLRPCRVFDYRFVGLSHNTVRGAAGGGILNAELAKAKGYF